MSDRGMEVVVSPVTAEAERGVDRNVAAMRTFDVWVERLPAKLVKIVDLQNKQDSYGELPQDDLEKLLRLQTQFQLEYPTMILSMPDIERNRGYMKRSLMAALSAGKLGNSKSCAETAIHGALATVTFVDLLHSLGPEFQKITIDELKVDWRTDAYGATDLAVSLGETVYAFSLKTVGGAIPATGMVQKVIGDEPILFGNKVVSMVEQNKMLGQVREWREKMDALGDHREIVPLVVFLPSEPDIVDKYLGFLNDDPRDLPKIRARVGEWRQVFKRRMRALGVEIPPDKVEGSGKINSNNGSRND